MTRQRVPNIELGSDAARANLLTNGGFEIWQRGNGPFATSNLITADRWGTYIAGTDTMSVSRDTTNFDVGSAQCAAVTFGLGSGAGASSYWNKQVMTDGGQLRGRQISFSIRVRTATANAVRAQIQMDGSGGGLTSSPFHTGGGTYQRLDVTVTVPTDATYVQVQLVFAASCTAYLDNAMLVIGSVPASYIPMHPADDLARCYRYYQRWAPGGAAYAITPGHATAATNAFLYLPMMATMPVTPTFTHSGLGQFGLINALYNAVLPATVLSGVLYFQNMAILNVGVASGLVAGNITGLFPSSAAAWISLEANP